MLQQRLQEGKEGSPYINSHPGLQTPLNHLQIDDKSSTPPVPLGTIPGSTAGAVSSTTNHNNAHSPSDVDSSASSMPGPASNNNQQLLKTAPSAGSGDVVPTKSVDAMQLKKEIKQEVVNGELASYRRRSDASSSSSSSSETVLKQPSPFTISSFLNTSRQNSTNPISDGFAQEFHQSVLRSTQEKLNQKKGTRQRGWKMDVGKG